MAKLHKEAKILGSSDNNVLCRLALCVALSHTFISKCVILEIRRTFGLDSIAN